MKIRIIIASLGLFISATSFAQVKKWTLEECVNYALENNISIQQSLLDAQSAEYNKKGAVGNFLPSVNANASHSWNIGLNQDITTGILVNQTTQNTALGASVGVDIFRGLNNLNQLHKANLQILANQYQIDGMKDDISLMVANAFLQILFNKESLKVAQSQHQLNLSELERTSSLIENGQLPEGEIYDLEANAASLEQQIVVAQNNVRLSTISLAQLLLISDYDNFEIASDDYDIPASAILDTNPGEIYMKALQIRNEVKISETNVEIAEKDYDLSVGGAMPTLSAFYSFNTRASNRGIVTGSEIDPDNPTQVIGQVQNSGDNVVAPNYNVITGSADPLYDQFKFNKGHSFGLQLNIPIFNGFSNHVNMQRNRINLEKAKLNLENTKIDLESNVYQAYNDATAAAKAYTAADKTQTARQQAYNYAEERYGVGVINTFEFTQTKQALEAAQSEVVRAKFDYIFKLKVLEFYFGIPITE
ncbi:TolC family protein [Reichenbachiella agariperforans]|uniref:TolC family protein n=1 Tax=Reichenbachiella agariperforans TaxID=156994 RepID=UPI001C0A510C|nr:TolC family protein [Reichenbachiella agariperforans]MBU2913617.1 TolC family protein [Reichenbachiella agariperforans]